MTEQSFLYENIRVYDRNGKNIEDPEIEKLYQEKIVNGDIHLNLDNKLQQIALNALGDEKGAVVAIDPDNGAILAMVSKSGSPQTVYNPGSTIKPFIALAGLELNTTSIDKEINCHGYYQLKGQTNKYRDWKRWGHGKTDMHTAIVQSCDVYFYDLASHLGINKIHQFLSQFGFGQKTNIDIPNGQSGLLPSKQWKLQKKEQQWFTGETLITAIGQGYFLATPLQLASAVATLANYGTYYQPQLVSSLSPKIINKLPINKKIHWGEVIKAMRDVVHSERGTARRIGKQKRGYKIAGKTGLAQIFKIKPNELYNPKNIDKKLSQDHALFIGFAPIKKPKIAIAVIVENGKHSGSTAAPIAAKVIDSYLQELNL